VLRLAKIPGREQDGPNGLWQKIAARSNIAIGFSYVHPPEAPMAKAFFHTDGLNIGHNAKTTANNTIENEA
jgi:hypothetical protein